MALGHSTEFYIRYGWEIFFFLRTEAIYNNIYSMQSVITFGPVVSEIIMLPLVKIKDV